MGDGVRGSFSNNVESYSQSTSTAPAAGSDIARTGSDSTTRVGSLVLTEPTGFNRQPETHSSLREPSSGAPSANKTPLPSDPRVGAFAVAGPNIQSQESSRSLVSSTADSIDSNPESVIPGDEYVVSMDRIDTDVLSVSGMDMQVDFMENIKLVTPPPEAVLITVAEPMEAEITYVGPTVVSDDDASISSDGSDIERQVELGLQFEQNFPDSIKESSIEDSDSQSAMSVEDDISSDHSMESQKARAKESIKTFQRLRRMISSKKARLNRVAINLEVSSSDLEYLLKPPLNQSLRRRLLNRILPQLGSKKRRPNSLMPIFRTLVKIISNIE